MQPSPYQRYSPMSRGASVGMMGPVKYAPAPAASEASTHGTFSRRVRWWDGSWAIRRICPPKAPAIKPQIDPRAAQEAQIRKLAEQEAERLRSEEMARVKAEELARVRAEEAARVKAEEMARIRARAAAAEQARIRAELPV